MSNLTEQVYRTLRRQIMSGDLAPGSQIKEERVAAGLGVSRTPARAVFLRLIQDRLLISRRSRGAFVAEWTGRDIDEIFELRILLGAHAAGLAALYASPEQVAELCSATEAMRRFLKEKPLDFLSAIQTANSRFHRTVLEDSGSSRLRTLASTLVDIPMVVGAFCVYSDSDIERSIQHHLDLQVAIEQRDRALAQEIMSVHLRMAYLIFMRSRRAGSGEPDDGYSEAELSQEDRVTEPRTDAALTKVER